MNIKFIPLFISLSVLSGNALADAPEARHDWTGFYVGGFVGGAAGTKTNTTEPIDQIDRFWNDPFSSPSSYHTKASVMGGVRLAITGNLGNHLI
ncbi:MAG: hypothetical protein SCG81_05865 [Nitrosomonadaceae bacterium]|nr:hypothetical protein [Nitrosomonadaceae bacterium]